MGEGILKSPPHAAHDKSGQAEKSGNNPHNNHSSLGGFNLIFKCFIEGGSEALSASNLDHRDDGNQLEHVRHFYYNNRFVK